MIETQVSAHVGQNISAHGELSGQTLRYIKRKFRIQHYIVIFIHWEKSYIVSTYVFNFQFQLFFTNASSL